MSDSQIHWTQSTARNALTDIEEICKVVNPHMSGISPRVRIWDSKMWFRAGPFDDLSRSEDLGIFEDFLGESHEDYMARLKSRAEVGGEGLTLRLMEGSDPLRPVSLPEPKMSLLNTVQLAGVDSTLATIDQFDDMLAITSGDFHWLNKVRDFQASRTDLYVLNPMLVKCFVPGKVHSAGSRGDVAREISKTMRELEYGLASRFGSGKLTILDGTLFGQDKHMTEELVTEGIIFCSLVKNPVSKIVGVWYNDFFEKYGYEKAAIDAVAYNDVLRPGTRSPLIFAQMLGWTSKVFAYYKPLVPGTTVLRIEMPADYAYMADHIIEALNCACSVGGDPYNSTAIPVIHAEHVAKTMLPDPYQIAEYLKASLRGLARNQRMPGSFNERRGFRFAN